MTDLHDPTPAPPDAPVSKHAPTSEGEASGSSPVRLAILAGLLVFAGVAGGWALPVVILGVVVMIFLHELGHYLAAKVGGMKVTEFFIGFGPKIWSFQRGETEYGLKAIPAGAYVKIIGMNNLDEVAPGEEDRTYRSKSYPKRMLVAVAGSAMHFAQALVMLFVLYAFIGVPGGSLTALTAWELRTVEPGSAADQAGLLPGDEILTFDGRQVDDYDDFRQLVADRPGEDVVATIARDGRTLEVPITIGVRDDDPSKGLLGILPASLERTTGPVEAVGASVSDFWAQTSATLRFIPGGMADLVSRVTDGATGGPAVEGTATGSGSGQTSTSDAGDDANRIISIVGAVGIGAQLTETGLLGFLLFFVGINITIGIFNLLPLLPLDGGHVVVATYERIREFARPRGERYHVDFARLIPVVYTVFLLLVLLGVTTIYFDIADPVSL